MSMQKWIMSVNMRKEFEWDKWVKEIPAIKFEPTWEVRVIPPFCSAVVRFCVVCGNADLSVYLDCYDQLGRFGEPYWELYPHRGDTARFKMNDITGLRRAIKNEIKRQNNRK